MMHAKKSHTSACTPPKKLPPLKKKKKTFQLFCTLFRKERHDRRLIQDWWWRYKILIGWQLLKTAREICIIWSRYFHRDIKTAAGVVLFGKDKNQALDLILWPSFMPVCNNIVLFFFFFCYLLINYLVTYMYDSWTGWLAVYSPVRPTYCCMWLNCWFISSTIVKDTVGYGFLGCRSFFTFLFYEGCFVWLIFWGELRLDFCCCLFLCVFCCVFF